MDNLIGTRLKIARRNKNLTQIQVMERTDINHKTLSGYEKGVSKPNLETLTILGKFYETSTDYLLGLTDNPQAIKILADQVINNPYFDTLTPKEQIETLAVLRCIVKELERHTKKLGNPS
jgi:transcriptional regulator with XRE-family HTH domain